MSDGTHIVTLPLLKGYDRPTVKLYNVKTLIDPGSVFLIVDMTDEYVRKLFGGKNTGFVKTLTGVGECEAKVYMFEHFCIGDMVFRDFPALVGTLANKETPIVIGSAMYSRGTKYEIDTELNQITFKFPEVFFRAGKPCIRRKRSADGWGFLGYQNGGFVAMPTTII